VDRSDVSISAVDFTLRTSRRNLTLRSGHAQHRCSSAPICAKRGCVDGHQKRRHHALNQDGRQPGDVAGLGGLQILVKSLTMATAVLFSVDNRL
jgi:hypothetical protein